MGWKISDRADDLARTDQGIDPDNSQYVKTMNRLRKEAAKKRKDAEKKS